MRPAYSNRLDSVHTWWLIRWASASGTTVGSVVVILASVK